MSRSQQLPLEIDAGGSSSSSLSSGSNITPSFPTSSLPLSDIVILLNLKKEPELLLEEKPLTVVAETGPDVFHLRRKRWLTPSENGMEGSNTATPDIQDCSARVRLDKLILEPEISDKTWAAGVNNVWNGLINGGRLKKPLPLEVVVKVLKAGWHRDGTWPKGLIVPSSPPLPPLDELEPAIEEEHVTLSEAVAVPVMSIPASAAVQERLIRIEGADGTGYLSDISRERLEQAMEKYDGNLESLADEDIMRIKYDPWSSWKQSGQDENAVRL